MKKKYLYKPYNTLFPKLFEQEKNRLMEALNQERVIIEHIGSTAVPGLGGKGIIDIGVAVAREDMERISHAIEHLGYLFRETGSTPERWFFRMDLPDDQEGSRRYHLHLTFPEGLEWKQLIAFREYLRSHPCALKEYAALKKKSAEEVNEDGVLYRKKKAPFFEKVLAKVHKHTIYCIIGASGSGKTSTINHLIPPPCTVVHFDSVGTPSFEAMEHAYGSVEEWQRIKTIDWVKKITEEVLPSSHVIFDAQIRPSFIKEACSLYGVDYRIVLLDCSDEERKRRLTARGDHALADEKMMHWAAYLRKECQHHKIINNTHLTIEQTAHLLSEWLSTQMDTQLEVPLEMVKELIATQFPEYANLPIQAVKLGGWDNRTFSLGKSMSIRLPSAKRYAVKIPIEHTWLPKLAFQLSIPIPTPIALGKSSKEYPWSWSIYGWIEGQSANALSLDDRSLENIAIQLAHFLNELHAIDASEGPPPGKHNFFRGSSLLVYDAEMRSTIDVLGDDIDTERILSIWERAIRSSWNQQPVWIHGDFASSNLLIKDDYLVGVIDFGGMTVGDPACDLVIAWTFLKGTSRALFKSGLKLIDEETWNRAKGWALWKALMTLESIEDRSNIKAQEQFTLINDILNEV